MKVLIGVAVIFVVLAGINMIIRTGKRGCLIAIVCIIGGLGLALYVTLVLNTNPMLLPGVH